MTIKILPFILLFIVCGNSCKNDAAQSGTTQTETTAPEVAPVAAPDASFGTAPDAALQTTAPATATTGTAGMKNPPHGEPGHVCGKPVGSILDGTAATTNAGAPAQAAPTTTAKPAAAPTTVAPGSNPAHGQPGHRCDIAVGAPLDSKPKQ